jgi:hypothetical protein
VEEARPFRFESDWFPLFGSVGAPSRRAMEQADRSVNSIFFLKKKKLSLNNQF